MGINPVVLRSKIRRFLKGKEKLFLKESVIKLATLINNKSINRCQNYRDLFNNNS